MKRILVVLTAALFLFSCSNAPKSGDEAVEQEPAANAEWVEVVLNVDGMTCEGCENAVKSGVESLEGIAEVESSHEEAWTKVKFDKSTTSLEEIEGKITETGYEVKGLKEESTL